jgi:hypothetical protein
MVLKKVMDNENFLCEKKSDQRNQRKKRPRSFAKIASEKNDKKSTKEKFLNGGS